MRKRFSSMLVTIVQFQIKSYPLEELSTPLMYVKADTPNPYLVGISKSIDTIVDGTLSNSF